MKILKVINVDIPVHYIQAKIIEKIRTGDIDLEINSLREIAEIINEDSSPQKIKHHLDSLVTKGILDKIAGYYKYSKRK